MREDTMLQPQHSVIELCHVVTDMDAAIRYWTSVIGAGPFFVGDMELKEKQFYRGKPCEQSIQVAFGFSGGLLIELVRPIRDIPSAFREVLDQRGPGYHHVMLRVGYDEGFELLSKQGYDVALQSTLPSGERCALFDARRDSGGYIEIMDISPFITRQLENMQRAHREWDGRSEPIRSMASSFA
jgi:Glyoxalase/Bleomycin resistance protein/Dioxygenase superfamily